MQTRIQNRAYQREVELGRWAGPTPSIHLGAFHLLSTNGDPRLLAEEVTKRGKVFRGERGEEIISPSFSSSSSTSPSSHVNSDSEGVSSPVPL
jgi:hypothetical protein